MKKVGRPKRKGVGSIADLGELYKDKDNLS
jgi:hypothetical protein